MKNFTLLFLLCFTAFGTALAQETDIPYKEANRYFLKNSYPKRALHMLKITDSVQFESIFGMATVMGEGGIPTLVNFAKSYVIALIVNDEDQRISELRLKSLTKRGDNVMLAYDMKLPEDPKGGYARYFKIYIVDNKYMGYLVANYSPADGEMEMMGADFDEYNCKPSTGYTWSILMHDCIRAWETKYILDGKDINAMENAALLFNEDGSKGEIIGSKFGRNLILERKNNNSWTNGGFSLVETKKDHFIFKDKNKEIAQGSLRD